MLKTLSNTDIMSKIPDPRTIKFEPLEMQLPGPPQLQILPGIDCDDPLALFKLLPPDSLWNIIV